MNTPARRRGRPPKTAIPQPITFAPEVVESGVDEAQLLLDGLDYSAASMEVALPLIEVTAQLVEALERGDVEARSHVEELIARYRTLYGAGGEASFRHAFEGVTKTRRRRLPEVIPQQTSQEVRSLAVALSDGRALARWEEVLGEVALRHVIAGEPFQIKFSPGAALLSWSQGSLNEELLRGELQACDLDTVLLLYEMLGTAVAQMGSGEGSYVTLSLDDLIASLGWDKAARRNGEERNRLRLRIWSWLLVFDSLRVIGQRPGRYRDPGTRQVLDLRSDDALLRIMGQRVSDDVRTPDGRPMPLEVTFAPGPWIERHRGNRQILTEFGNVRMLARIPGGKAAGSWARCIGMTLLQRWREGATRVTEAKISDSEGLATSVIRWLPFSRRSLLTGLFCAQPDVMEILNGSNPSRALEYWDQAIQLLQMEGFISKYSELKPITHNRHGWKDEWLDSPLEITPGEEPLAAAREIMKSSRRGAAKTASAKVPKKRGRPPKQWKED